MGCLLTSLISVQTFIAAIRELPADKPSHQSGVWYETEKEHWLGWLVHYHTEGAYGRKASKKRDACFAYTHIVNWQMLEWLIRAAGVDAALVKQAQRNALNGNRLQEKAAAIRRVVSWETMASVLWPAG